MKQRKRPQAGAKRKPRLPQGPQTGQARSLGPVNVMPPMPPPVPPRSAMPVRRRLQSGPVGAMPLR